MEIWSVQLLLLLFFFSRHWDVAGDLFLKNKEIYINFSLLRSCFFCIPCNAPPKEIKSNFMVVKHQYIMDNGHISNQCAGAMHHPYSQQSWTSFKDQSMDHHYEEIQWNTNKDKATYQPHGPKTTHLFHTHGPLHRPRLWITTAENFSLNKLFYQKSHALFRNSYSLSFVSHNLQERVQILEKLK